MAWNDIDDSDAEKALHRIGARVQQGAQNMGQSVDNSIDRLHALHKITGGSAAGPGLSPQQQMQQQPPMPVPGIGGGAASMNAGVGTMDEMAAQRQRMLDMYNAASAEKQAAQQPEDDMSGYTPFQALKNKIQTPDDEDDDKNTRGSTRDTGTLGGV
jgi:hypothetical protein